MRFRTIIAAAAAPLAIGGVLLATAGQASAAVASPTAAVLTSRVQHQKAVTVYAATSQRGVDDTFSPPGAWSGPVDPTGNGPIWAYDNVERLLTAVQQPDGSWAVTLCTIGQYKAFANPVTGQYPVTPFSGLLASESTWTVPAGYTPSKANLPAQADPSYRSQNLVSQFFGQGPSGLSPAMTSGHWYYFGIPGAPGGVVKQIYP